MALNTEGSHGVFTAIFLQCLRGSASRDGNCRVEVRELIDHPDLPRRSWGIDQYPSSAIEGHSYSLLSRR